MPRAARLYDAAALCFPLYVLQFLNKKKVSWLLFLFETGCSAARGRRGPADGVLLCGPSG